MSSRSGRACSSDRLTTANLRLTARQARFARELALQVAAGQGENATEAARAAGYKGSSIKVTACRLAQDPRVRAIVDVEVAKAAEQLEEEFGIKTTTILRELSHMGFARLRDVMDWGEDGYYVRKPSEVIERGHAALQEMTITEDRIGPKVIRRRTKVKLASKREALMDLARLAGLLNEDKTPMASVQIVINGGPMGMEVPPRTSTGVIVDQQPAAPRRKTRR